jgi:hypothetical protein
MLDVVLPGPPSSRCLSICTAEHTVYLYPPICNQYVIDVLSSKTAAALFEWICSPQSVGHTCKSALTQSTMHSHEPLEQMGPSLLVSSDESRGPEHGLLRCYNTVSSVLPQIYSSMKQTKPTTAKVEHCKCLCESMPLCVLGVNRGHGLYSCYMVFQKVAKQLQRNILKQARLLACVKLNTGHCFFEISSSVTLI